MDKRTSIGWQILIDGDGLLIGDDGSLRFTGKRRDELTRYFAMAGIDIATVKTMDDYLAARQAASPYLIPFMVGEVERGKPSLERELLIATITGNERKKRKLKMQLATRRAAERKPGNGN